MKGANKWGYAGTRRRGKKGAFSVENATSPRGPIQFTGSLPFPIEGGFRILPEGLRDAARFAPRRDGRGLKAFWEKRIYWQRCAAEALRRKINRICGKLGPKESETEVKLNSPLLSKLLDVRDMGGQEMLQQFVGGFAMIGGLAEQAVYSAAKAGTPKLSREEPSGGAKGGANFAKARKDPRTSGLWEGALKQIIKGRLEGPSE